jgi:hypothetical protein
MKKINLTLLLLCTLISGCTKEVHLQQVPCVEDCPPCENFCEETDVMTEKVVFQIEDVERQKPNYKYNEKGNLVLCTHKCKQTKLEN